MTYWLDAWAWFTHKNLFPSTCMYFFWWHSSLFQNIYFANQITPETHTRRFRPKANRYKLKLTHHNVSKLTKSQCRSIKFSAWGNHMGKHIHIPYSITVDTVCMCASGYITSTNESTSCAEVSNNMIAQMGNNLFAYTLGVII